ncbi:MAG: hypothetical protein HC768_23315 [Acaryochloris sp. CRU_2_0]|nr:hypothetical protein [Acaryochloris sp. CRU_2_0]
MLTQPTKEESQPKPNPILQEVKDGFKLALGSIAVGAVLYTLLNASPYLIDRMCLQSGYAPVTLSKCLPEAEVKSKDWETTLPSPLGEVQVWKGKPISEVLPLFVLLGCLSFALTVAVSALGHAFGSLEGFSIQSGNTPKNK